MKVQQVNKKTGSRKMLSVLRYGEFGPTMPGKICLIVDKPFDRGRRFQHFLIGKGGKKREIEIENRCEEHVYVIYATYVGEIATAPAATTKAGVASKSRKKVASGPPGPDFSQFGLTLEPVSGLRGWFCGPAAEWQEAKELAQRMRASPTAKKHRVIVGHLDGDPGHRIYVAPPVSTRALVKTFRVGERCGMSYGADPEEVITRIAKRLTAVEKICPLVVTFADAAGLHAEFASRLTKDKAARIEKVFPTNDPMLDGLERYMSEWSGKGGLLAPTLIKEQAIQLWWD